MKILIACEESQTVCKAFRAKGHEAYNCDILPPSGGHTEWHLQGDVLERLREGWDMMIAHPPCTYLCGSGEGWMSHPDDKLLPKEQRRPHPKFPNRKNDRKEVAEFFMKLYNAPCEKIAVENPVGYISTYFRKPDQIVHPWMFGDEASKGTCLWLKGLPKLVPTKIVGKGEFITHKSGKRKAKWFADAFKLSPAERSKARSKTFQGIANAMAEQWS